MDLQLEENVAVILGAAQGIGRAIAAAFAAEGAATALVDRDASVVETARLIETEFGRPASGFTADVTKYDDLRRVAGDVLSQRGRLDQVVFAAGMGSGKFGFPFWNLEPADWQRVLDVNLVGAANAAHAFAPPLVEAKRGSMLFISSIAGQIGSQTDPPYSAAKAGLINFSQCAAKDLAPFNVRVNCICPGMVKTSLNQSVWAAWNELQPPDERQSYEVWAAEKIRRTVPLGRWQDPEDIAALAVFLCSSRAKNITGQTMNVDGGQVMHW
ncbi:MAG TPA: SDR family NAD(P)-dependent oxidoreductase [Pirellulales bacterium]|nr:SDR family NAD(P)-dependent oxidoreductase [Pirellulales bacterium]